MSTARRPLTHDGPKPICELHFVEMRAYSSRRNLTYYKCPCPGCESKTQRTMRPIPRLAPSRPTMCDVCNLPMVVHATDAGLVVTMKCLVCEKMREVRIKKLS